MAHEPKLEVYKIYLRPTAKTQDKTFGAFLTKKHPASDKKKAYKEFFQDLITALDTDYVVNDFNKKALSLDTAKGKITKSIKLKSVEHIIAGTIKGGRFGQKRSIGNIKKPEKAPTVLSVNNIVLDTFYFLLYTPLGSDKGLLLIQSYTEDQISDVFTSWLRSTFKTSGFNQPNFESYVPLKLQQEFKNKSSVRELKFTNDVLVSDIDAASTIGTETFTVTVSIKVKDGGEKISKLGELLNLARKIRFGNKKNPLTLDEFRSQTGMLHDGTHQSSFELGGQLDIKPTIYLKNRIATQPDGTPVWESLEQFCLTLLEEIKPEVYPENDRVS
jgi:hypothetical protein